MKARVKWIEQVAFLGESESGHGILMDGAPAYGGRNLGPRPMELLLMGAGGCTSFDVVTILKKGRQDVTDCYVELDAERAETTPRCSRRYTCILSSRAATSGRTPLKRQSASPLKNIAPHPSCWARLQRSPMISR